MRKILCFFICVVMITLCSCKRAEPSDIKGSFEADVIVKFSESPGNIDTAHMEVSGDFLRGQGAFTITTPDELATLSYKWGRGFEISFDSLECRTEASHLPSGAFMQVLYKVLCHVTVNGECKGKSGELWEFEGCTEGMDYRVLADNKGYIKNISVEELNFSAEFTYKE